MQFFHPVKLAQYLSILALLLVSDFIEAAEDRGLFWLAQKEDHKIYLLGSVHLADDDFYPLRQSIRRAYADSDALVVEADILAAEKDSALRQQIMRESLYLGERTLRDDLSPETYRRLQTWLQQRQLSEMMFIRQRPATAMLAISMMELQGMGLDPSLGMDRHFLQLAKRDGKTIVELEGVLQQLRLLNRLQTPDLLIQQTLEQLEEIKAFAPRMETAWKSGDADALYRLIIADNLMEHPEFKSLYDTLFFQRNQTMADRIIQTAESKKFLFVVIGAGHLVGERSVIDLLKKRGYRVDQY